MSWIFRNDSISVFIKNFCIVTFCLIFQLSFPKSIIKNNWENKFACYLLFSKKFRQTQMHNLEKNICKSPSVNVTIFLNRMPNYAHYSTWKLIILVSKAPNANTAVPLSTLNSHFSNSTRQKRNSKSIPMLLRRAATIYLVRGRPI